MVTIRIKESQKELNIYPWTEKQLTEFVKGLADDITQNLKQSRALTDEIGNYTNPTPLRESYRKFKQKKYGYDNIFWGRTKKLLKSVRIKKTGILSRKIFIASDRDEVADYINNGTTKMPARRFFGISNEKVKGFEEKFNKSKINA